MEWDESKYLEPKLTEVSEAHVVYALREAWKKIFGNYPSNETLAIIWGQVMLETGRAKSMYNWNLGNVKSRPNDGFYYTMYKCSEIINGREIFFEPPHDQCKFRAYKSLQEAAEQQIKFLNRDRYKKALNIAKHGDVVEYTKELKRAGYFTAGLSHYIKGMKSITAEFHRRSNELLSYKPTDDDVETIPAPPPKVSENLDSTAPVVVSSELTYKNIDLAEPESLRSSKDSIVLDKKDKQKKTAIGAIVAIIVAALAWALSLFDK